LQQKAGAQRARALIANKKTVSYFKCQQQHVPARLFAMIYEFVLLKSITASGAGGIYANK